MQAALNYSMVNTKGGGCCSGACSCCKKKTMTGGKKTSTTTAGADGGGSKPNVQKELFAPATKENKGPSLEDRHRQLLDVVFKTHTAKEILKYGLSNNQLVFYYYHYH